MQNLWGETVTVRGEAKPAPGAVILRPYQQAATAAVLEAFKENQAVLVVMPTGTGKTVLFAEIAKRMAGGGRVLVLAHREELVFQAAAKMRRVGGLTTEIEMAGSFADEYASEKCQCVVATVQTMRVRAKRFKPDEFALVIVDEAHHAPAKSYRDILDYFDANHALRVLGVTATPDRADEKALGMVFDHVAYDYELVDAINDGWLVGINQRRVPITGLDFSRVRTTAGDLNEGDLEEILTQEGPLHGIADCLATTCRDRTLVFAATVRHADMLAEILNRHQPNCARMINGKTPTQERRQLLRDYEEDRYRFLVNVGIATEGFDSPGIQCVAIARPTKSRALFSQMVGRGTRVLAGVVDGMEYRTAQERLAAIRESLKPSLTVLDFAGNSGRHKLVSCADILGGNYNDDEIELAERFIDEQMERDDAKPADVAEALSEAKAELERRREVERERRMRVVGKATWELIEVDPFDALDITPVRIRGWHEGKQPTEKMIQMLERNGVKFAKDYNYAHAVQLCREIIDHPEKMPPTRKQAGVLARYGYDPSELNKAEASKIMDKLAKNGWRKPK